MKKISDVLVFAILLFLLEGCKGKYDPDHYFSSQAEKDSLISVFHPYVLPRPNDFPLADRFKDSMKVYYREQAGPNELQLYKYYIGQDSLHYGVFVRRDPKSLYIDYRAIAATFNRNKDSVYNIELKFLTPMFRKDTIFRKTDELFDLLIETGGVKKYEGNRDFVDWPNQDVYYDKVERKWALKKASEWNNVQEEMRKE